MMINHLEMFKYLIVIIVVIRFGDVSNATCKINLDKRQKKNPPMILDTKGEMIYPTKSRELSFGKFFILYSNLYFDEM